jgi:hypothetical protein
MIPKSVVWLSDLAREAHEKHDQEVYLRKKMAEMEASLREKKLLSDQESGADKYKDQYFSVCFLFCRNF